MGAMRPSLQTLRALIRSIDQLTIASGAELLACLIFSVYPTAIARDQ
jgi:hypothetical protein